MSQRQALQTIPENCTGCMLCRLACAMIKTKKFSYSRALIDVTRVGNVERYHPAFNPECDACGFCVHYCAFDALRNPRKASGTLAGSRT